MRKKPTELERLFLREKPVKILLSIKNGAGYTTQVAKETDCTYSHTIKVLNVLSKLGLVEFEKSGRKKNVSLTEEGEEVAHEFEGLIKKFVRITSELERKEE